MASVILKNPQSLNLYSYVGNSPIDRIDPKGLSWVLVCEQWSTFEIVDDKIGPEIGPRFWKCSYEWVRDTGRPMPTPPHEGGGGVLVGGGYTDLTPKNDPNKEKTKKISNCFQDKLKSLNEKFQNEQKKIERNYEIAAWAITAELGITIIGAFFTGGLALIIGGGIAISGILANELIRQSEYKSLNDNFKVDVNDAFKECVESNGGQRTDGKGGNPL